ncbi:MAG: hypothetical protein FWH03_04580 [Firmicutes bacterium]|nr:hypothetical protein [Bacillota bacterium]
MDAEQQPEFQPKETKGIDEFIVSFVALCLSIAGCVCAPFWFWIFPLLFAAVPLAAAGITLGVFSLCIYKKRVKRRGKTLSVLAIALPLTTASAILIIFWPAFGLLFNS